MPFVVTIDGPAGSGKSTAARKLASRLNIAYLDTGAMYRAIAYACIKAGLSVLHEAEVDALIDRLHLEMDCGPTHSRVKLDGRDVTEHLRREDVAELVSRIAQFPYVREQLVSKQREIARQLRKVVTEGRDQGSAVFPDAKCRFVLTADVAKRAERRYHEMQTEGNEDVTLEWVISNLRYRDERDTVRWNALLSDAGVIVVDTTYKTLDEVIDELEKIVIPRLEEYDGPQLFE